MNILHYSLGLPPYRTGGLTKYSIDLMGEQAKHNDRVFLLFPGRIKSYEESPKIKYYKKYNLVNVYELINPIAVPLLNGINKPNQYIKKCEKEVFVKFLCENKIGIVHIHTLMGIYSEFFEACNDLKIKVVYTTHDYFGLCSKVNFIDSNGLLCDGKDLNKCITCNESAYGLRKIKILQSGGYRFLKNHGFIKKLKKVLSLKKKVEIKEIKDGIDKNLFVKLEDYKELINHYHKIFSKINYFIFNSNIAKSIFANYNYNNGEVLSITHGDIKDNRSKKNYSNNILRLSYLGPAKEYKGFNILCKMMKELNDDEGNNVILNLYGDSSINREVLEKNMIVHGEYNYSELGKIMNNTDVLLVPSIWYETFGFIVLEALSYGVPVIVTDKVGSKDIVDNKGVVVKSDYKSFAREVKRFIDDRSYLKKYNKNIIDDEFKGLLVNHVEDIKKIYVKVREMEL